MKTKTNGIILFLLLFITNINAQSFTLDSIYITNATSCSVCNGSAIADVSGGFTPYYYNWSNGGSSQVDSNLCAGTYTLMVADWELSEIDRVFIIGPPSISIFASSVNTSACGNIGSATVSVSGGSTPYTYSWSPGGETTASITGLSAGSYTVIVNDNNGCISSSTANIAQPSPLSTEYIITTGATCSNNNGTISDSMVNGGTRPYTYSWSPSGQTNITVTGLSSGTYTLTVTDNYGCTVSDSAVVPFLGPVPNITRGNDSCYGESNGFLIINSVNGGVAPYTYSWNPSGNTTDSIGGLSAGVYNLIITDSNGCTGTSPIYLDQPQPVTIIVDTLPDTGSCSGSVLILGDGGTQPYSCIFSNIITINDTFQYMWVDSLCYGSYWTCITDAHGCSYCDSVHIRHAARVTGIGNIKNSEGELKIYPNPAGDKLFIATEGMKQGNYSIYVYDMIGRLVFNSPFSTLNPQSPIPIDVSGLPAGKYMVRVSGDNQNKMAPFIIIR